MRAVTRQWTETAINAALSLSKTQRAKLKKVGALDRKWPISITAERYAKDDPDVKETKLVSKIIHFQRHGQGYHNLLGDVFRELGNEINLEERDPKKNPFLRPEIVDAPLTEQGRLESASWRPDASLLSPQLVIVSPMCRAVQTALLTFVDHRERVPWVAHEGCREDMGMHVCNRRRRLSEIVTDFPTVDFSFVESGEEDTLWDPDDMECPLAKADRAYAFLTEFVKNRPEKEIAVVTHSAWLFNLCNAVMDCGDDETLSAWFLTSEIRSMRITFTEES